MGDIVLLFMPRKPHYIFLACAAGFSYSLVGISYELGRSHSLTPRQIMAACSLLATAFFFVKLVRQRNSYKWTVTSGKSNGDFSGNFTRLRQSKAPRLVWACGILSGLTQYALLRLIALGLDLGPLSPVWIAASLGFIPTILYATWRFQEQLGGRRLLAVAAAVACILLPELAASPSARLAGSAGRYNPVYPLVLVLIALANSVQLGSVKLLGTTALPQGRDVRQRAARSGQTGTYMDRHGIMFMFLANASLALATTLDMGLTGGLPATLRWLSALGALAGIGSILGISLLSACSRGPAALIFTSSGVSSILGAALVSVFFFGEAADPGWFIMVGMSVLAILLGASSPPSNRARSRG